jgi:hypothetical protein
MSKISLAPDDSGTGIFTIASPNSDTNRTLTLPDDTGTIVTDSGNQAGSFTTLNTSGAVVFNDAGADVDFRVEGDTDANLLFVDASTDRVGIGTNTPSYTLDITNSASGLRLGSDVAGYRFFREATGGDAGLLQFYGSQSGYTGYIFDSVDGERVRIDTSGNLLVGRTATWSGGGDNTTGIATVSSAGQFIVNATGSVNAFVVNNTNTDNAIISIRQANTEEGNISISGSTVSYNGGHLSRWAQMLTKPDLLKGTVMSNLDEMNVYVKPTLYWTEEDELPVDEEGNPTVAVGDLKQETSVSDNEQLNKVKVSDVEGDPNVAGVFVNWTYDEAHQVDEINMAMTGDMIIRIAEGVTVARGDLLMSAGDGTAKPQGDDIVRSKTIAKVTSTHVTCTYEDGSYCVPCVLMAC